jgi:3-hydroxymyristoyl/3-hydroxydecanoyl-(acyl carrier protein) dehydratase
MTEHDQANFLTQASSLAQAIDAMLEVEPVADGYRAVLRVDPSLLILADHFAHQPLLPGICMIQASLLAAARVLHEPGLRLAGVKNAKMTHPVAPRDVVDLQGVIEPGEQGHWRIKTRLTLGETRIAEISLQARRES